MIEKADREHPADAVLRAELKTQRGLSPSSSRAISRAVFAYYRWWKWLGKESVPQLVAQALELQERFSMRPSSFTDEELASKAIPSWVREEVEVSPGWLRSLQAEPKLWLRARFGQGQELARRLGASWVRQPTRLGDAVQYTGEEDLFRTPEFQAGEFEIQDISSQLVGVVCDPFPGQTWWDACAGEGGKTLHLSDLMRNRGLIWATDRVEWRLKRLKLRAARAKVFNYRTAVWAGTPKLPTKTKFDGVLVDAPCSGLGTWQRNPHARWTMTLDDVRELAEIQNQLLALVASAVKPGGKLIYAVCTLTDGETKAVAKRFESSHPQFQLLPLPNPLQPSAQSAQLWISPQDSGGNGMFVAAWQRKAEKAVVARASGK